MATKLLQIVAVFCVTLMLLSLLSKKEVPLQQEFSQPHHIWPQPYVPPLQKPAEPQVPITEKPEFITYPAIRTPQQDLGEILSDIECHMPAGHIYKDNDKITWGHETSHGLASNIRMKFSRGYGAWQACCGEPVFKSFARINGFYILNNRAVVIDEPDTTIRKTAILIPNSLRGDVYNLYMVQQTGGWNDTPLYVFDEWIAYANGSAVRADLKIQSRAETVQYMLEFDVYAICVGWSSKTEDKQFKTFLKWHLKRSMELLEVNRQSGGDLSKSVAYWEKVKTSPDAEEFRNFARQYLGEAWVKHILGF